MLIFIQNVFNFYSQALFIRNKYFPELVLCMKVLGTYINSTFYQFYGELMEKEEEDCKRGEGDGDGVKDTEGEGKWQKE